MHNPSLIGYFDNSIYSFLKSDIYYSINIYHVYPLRPKPPRLPEELTREEHQALEEEKMIEYLYRKAKAIGNLK